MARLAAYYQEDFHYPSVAYAPKQRKSAYLLYEEPKNNVFGSHQFNGNRIRSLAASEPSLVGELPYAPHVNNMTLKQRPYFYGSQVIENPHTSHPYFETEYYVPQPRGIEPETFDNESVFSFCDTPYDDRYDQRHRLRSRDKSRKRYSYAETRNTCLNPPDMYITQNVQRHHQQRSGQEENMYNYNNGHRRVVPDNYHTNVTGHSLSPPVFFPNDPRQQWPWARTNAFVNTSLLSPPSPLDSGLSSQSIASSPSLEPEPVNVESYPTRSHRHRNCSCPRLEYSENVRYGNRYDSGRSSPGFYAMAYPANAVPRTNSRMSNHIKDVDYHEESFEDHGQVRYGKLGIVGEPTDFEQTFSSNSPKKRYDSLHQQEPKKNGKVPYINNDKNGVSLRKGTRKPHNPESKYTKPCVIIVESPEKGTNSERTSSPEQDNSVKSPGSESPMSVTASNSSSNSPSVASSSNDLDHEERRKTDKTTENEIRELEDMYEKCNLGDSDLFDRAERRDLPTAHQRKADKGGHRLTRSNSDTLYEIMSPVFHNPYETHQRAPPLRRAGLPDRIADDMALRKYRKTSTRPSSNPARNTITYMLCSSHFTPTVPASKDILLLDNPDVELDDLSYRKHYFGKKSKIRDPQPPFGIPLRPPPPQRVYSDYLHVVPSSAPQPLCHPRGNPDVVRDDMAFRTLRKDEPERIYYDIAQMYKNKR